MPFVGATHAFYNGYCLAQLEKRTGIDRFAAFPKLKAITASIQGLESASKIGLPVARGDYQKAEDDPVFAAFEAKSAN